MNDITAKAAVLIAVCVGFAGLTAFSCTGLYVGRKASADGTTLIARTVDSRKPTRCKRFEILERVEKRSGRHFCASDTGAEWPLPETTYKAVTVPSVDWKTYGRYEGACCNEKGVMMTGTITGITRAEALSADPYVKEGFGESSLPGLLIVSSATAREAVELLGRVIAARGHHGAEIYIIADADETWYVEVYTGHQWAAVKLPEDKMLVIGNHFSLRSFDPSSPDTLSSEGLIAVPEKAGFLKRGSDGLIDLAETYAPLAKEQASIRTWAGRRRFAPKTAGTYDPKVRLPLLFAPERKVSVRDLQEVMRWRYEGTGLCPEENPESHVRVIGVSRQCSCHVLALDPTLPPATRVTMWVTLSNGEHAPFLPLNASITALAEGFDLSLAHPSALAFPSGRFVSAIPAVHFRRLCALAELDRRRYGDGVRAYWRKLEDAWLAEYPALVRKGDAAVITRYSVAAQERALADAKRIFDDLTWYITDRNHSPWDYTEGHRPEETAPFAP